MIPSRLPREVRKLLETELDSLEKLELIRYLRRAKYAVARHEIVRALHLDREAADALIDELARGELVETTADGGAVQLGTAATGATCDDLMRIYDEDRLQIVSVMSSLAVARIRRMAARTFGEALASKKKPSNDEGK
jgi:hypothetical protein